MTQANASQTGNGAAAAAPASSTAEPSALDTALKEFESANAQPTAIQAFSRVVEPIVRYAENKMLVEQNAEIESEVSAAIKVVRAEAKIDEKVPDEIVEAFLHREAAKNPQFEKAWKGRTEDKEGWLAKLKNDAAPKLKELIGKMPGDTVRTDVEAAMLAVRGVSHSPQSSDGELSPTQLFNLSDREFKAQEREWLAAGKR